MNGRGRAGLKIAAIFAIFWCLLGFVVYAGFSAYEIFQDPSRMEELLIQRVPRVAASFLALVLVGIFKTLMFDYQKKKAAPMFLLFLGLGLLSAPDFYDFFETFKAGASGPVPIAYYFSLFYGILTIVNAFLFILFIIISASKVKGLAIFGYIIAMIGAVLGLAGYGIQIAGILVKLEHFGEMFGWFHIGVGGLAALVYLTLLITEIVLLISWTGKVEEERDTSRPTPKDYTCPGCGETFTGKKDECPHCHKRLLWRPKTSTEAAR